MEEKKKSKDANESLVKYGKQYILDCLANARQPKIPGIITAEDIPAEMDLLYDNGIQEGKMLGVKGLDHLLKFEKGRLYIFTANAGTGKSTFMNFVISSLYVKHKWRTLVFSPEKSPVQYHFLELAQLILGRKFRKGNVTIEMKRRIMKYVSQNFPHVDHTRITDYTDIIGLIRQMKTTVDGVDVLLVDPVNWMTPDNEPGATEMQLISAKLKALILSAQEMNILVLLVAHPKKTDSKTMENLSLSIYDISGSADYANKCDVGVVLQRDLKTGLVYVCVQKVRFDHLGQIGRCALSYDKDTGRYSGCREVRIGMTGDAIQYIPEPFDKTNWIDGKVIQQQMNFEEESDMPF